MNQKILLVEDEAIIALAEKRQLEGYGYEVSIVHNGLAAIKTVLTDPDIDLVLMDIDLGRGIDGTVAAERILTQRNIPILFLSSHTEQAVVEKTERISSYGYVVKNSGIVVLDASIKMALKLFKAKLDQKRVEQALEKRMISLTRPLGHPQGLGFEDLFNIDDIQKLQDLFAEAFGVASIITDATGNPITEQSRFTRLCRDIIRQTEIGRKNCFKSDAYLGRFNPDGPTIQPCLSCGLWDAGAAISVEGEHIASWLIGQVRNELQSEESMRRYARKIGAEERPFIEAFYDIPSMSRERFETIARTLFTLANMLSDSAYQNV